MIKHLSLVVIALLVAANLSLAKEIPKNTVEISGDSTLGLNVTESDAGGFDDQTTTTFDLRTSALWYAANQFGVGGIIDLTVTDQEDFGNETILFLGPELKYQFPMNDLVNLYVHGAVGFAYDNIDVDDGPEIEGTGWFAGIGAGVAIFPVKWASINIGLDYTHADIEYDDDDIDETDATINSFDTRLGLSVYF